MQTIDPILPRKPLRPGHKLAPTVVSQSLRKPRPSKSIDGITMPAHDYPRPPQPMSLQRRAMQREAPVKPRLHDLSVRPVTTGLKLPVRHHVTKKQTIVILIAAVVLIAGALITKQPLGQPLFILYGIVALITGVSSRTTFILALATFIIIIVSLVAIGGPNIISGSFAEYAFLLLLTGTISLGRELYREG